MNVLVLNCGSTSLKAAVRDAVTGERLAHVIVERIDEHDDALARAIPALVEALDGRAIDAVGHRVVHGGDRFVEPVRIDAEVEAAIEALIPLAPLHNPGNLAGVRAARRLLPDVPHVAVFDTAFHSTLPRRASTYALPEDVREAHGLRRYGFHGTSHAFVAGRAAEYLHADLRALRLVTCHLGGGCSVAAVEYGRSIDTSMGMTPLEGLVMATRAGDVDPGILLALLRDGMGVDGLDKLLNRRSGLAGLSGTGGDLRDIQDRAIAGDDRCRLALEVFSHRVRKYVGAYAAVMGGVDAIVFTAGIGENSVDVRNRVAQRLEFLGARLDDDRNRDAKVDARTHPVAEISAPHSRVKILVVATDEEWEIARETASLVHGRADVSDPGPIPVAISGRHVHLDRAVCEALYGAGHALRVMRWLSQPGQFAAEERVTLVGPRGVIENVRVIGPLRGQTQVEISRTDEFTLGVDAPIRMSGDLANTPGITLRGPLGEVHIESGVICSQRHIHMAPDDASRFGVAHKDVVEVAIDSDGRDLVFRDVVIRVHPEFKLEMHIDTDEGNAAELSRGDVGVLLETSGEAHLSRRATRFDPM